MYIRSFLLMIALLTSGALHAQWGGRALDVVRKELQAASGNAAKVRLLTELANAYTRKPGEDSADLQAAFRLLDQATVLNNNTAKDDAATADIYRAYAEVWRESGKPDTAAPLLRKAIALNKRLERWEALGDCYIELKNVRGLEYSVSRNLLDTAVSFYRKAPNLEKRAGALRDLADCDQILGNFGVAILELNDALAFSKSAHRQDIQDIYSIYSDVYTQIGNYPEAVRYGLLALNTAKQTGDTSETLSIIYYRVGLGYANWGKYDESAGYIKSALKQAIHNQVYDDASEINYNLMNVYNHLQKYQESIAEMNETIKVIQPKDAHDSLGFMISYFNCYRKLGNDRETKRYGEILQDMEPGAPRMRLLAINYYVAVFTYGIYLHDPVLSKRYQAKLWAYTEASGNPKKVQDYYEKSTMLDSLQGDFHAAYLHVQRARQIADSLLSEKQRFQLNQIQTIYETEAKQKNIELLQSQNSRQQIVYKRNTAFLIIAILAVVAVLSVLFGRYRIKQKANKQLEEKQQEINGQNLQLTAAVGQQRILIDEKNGLIADKEWLLKEVHHRVKNNLQIVMSLLNQQAAYLTEKEALSAIEQSKTRMQAISLIHQLLYQKENSNQMDMKVYIETLVSYLADGFAAGTRVRFRLQLDVISLDIAQAIPLGLILNEAITNAIKYAFKGRDEGLVSITLQRQADNNICLLIRDNGVGFPPDFDWRESKSMGMQLIEILVRQLKGDISITSEDGLSHAIVFPEKIVR